MKDTMKRQKQIEKFQTGLEFLMAVQDGPIKVTDWDNKDPSDPGSCFIELEIDGHREWFTKWEAAERLYIAFGNVL